MDIRSLSLGAGLGVIAATLVIAANQAMMPSPPPGPEAQPAQPPVQADWKQAAEQAGMAVLPKQELDQKIEQAKNDGAKQKEAELAGQPAASSKVFVYITSGMGTSDVAVLLKAAGVIEDSAAFIQQRAQQTNPIREGTYELPLKADPKDVLKIIANPPHTSQKR